MLMGTAAPTKKQLDQYSSKKIQLKKTIKPPPPLSMAVVVLFFVWKQRCVVGADFLYLFYRLHVADNFTSQAPSAVYAA
ncbi:hypothetical protein [Photobacterium ganghwense]|uniref:hypothetical protein n=1 Tax=Photobacterium ganghwense TaxID=320778 RepID=UPI001C2DAECC|nr:hypothetical protein [Photobacterium ganghwense]MBV1842692.1 hypothetical protein [Photobacterium ganghwense]